MSKRCDSNKNMRAAFQMLNSHSRNSGRILLGDYLDYISLKFKVSYQLCCSIQNTCNNYLGFTFL